MAEPKRLRYPNPVTEASSFLDPVRTIPGIRAGWVERVADLPIQGDRDEAMRTLRPHHDAAAADFAGPAMRRWRAEQVHGHAVALVPGAGEITAPDGLPVVPGVDGLITATPGQLLCIYVADCGAIWLADRRTRAIGLLHSGKKGSEQNILGEAVGMMQRHFGTRPEDLVAVLSPCIRPPHYEIDFAQMISQQASACRIGHYLDCGLDTAADLERFYSYRVEKGQTGRMMAMMVSE